ncbi:Phage gp6-like head-tail connector protein [Aquimixticola soesokkakensis]|uniref:Phage gp6-like head-tail connector protein n=1 Tax=Aquimixticola soesokkakensis TaxID=1519096 RepID=A0A1Y5SBK2_9RHOB|nr:head-tail connector protein [Aquimixticola soesokkakensis]SLN36614.1 Phage gp6-like head-tail connector protein [Aquimixticola soesokkakensis]
MHRPVLITSPTETPVTLAEAKGHLRVDFDDDDSLISGYISAATVHLDGYAGLLGRCMVSQTWEQKYDRWRRVLRLPFPDVSSVEVGYTDEDDEEITVSTDLYTVLQDQRGHYIRFSDRFSSPNVGPDRAGIRISFNAGFGAAADVPWSLKAAILLFVGSLYVNRETSASDFKPTMAFEALIAPHRRVGV